MKLDPGVFDLPCSLCTEVGYTEVPLVPGHSHQVNTQLFRSHKHRDLLKGQCPHFKMVDATIQTLTQKVPPQNSSNPLVLAIALCVPMLRPVTTLPHIQLTCSSRASWLATATNRSPQHTTLWWLKHRWTSTSTPPTWQQEVLGHVCGLHHQQSVSQIPAKMDQHRVISGTSW